jgi:hypothetical protein
MRQRPVHFPARRILDHGMPRLRIGGDQFLFRQ